MIKIEINDHDVTAMLHRLYGVLGNLRPVMQDIGEYGVVSTKERFKDGTAPDGRKWDPNRPSTIMEYLRRRGGDTSRRPGEKSANPYFGKRDGRLNKRGATLVSGKRPLIGETKRLSNEINYRADGSSVAIGSSLIQAAVQQFGAKRGSFGSTKGGRPIPWGDIPAREFLGLSAKDKDVVLGIINEHLAAATRQLR